MNRCLRGVGLFVTWPLILFKRSHRLAGMHTRDRELLHRPYIAHSRSFQVPPPSQCVDTRYTFYNWLLCSWSSNYLPYQCRLHLEWWGHSRAWQHWWFTILLPLRVTPSRWSRYPGSIRGRENSTTGECCLECFLLGCEIHLANCRKALHFLFVCV